VNRVNGNLSDKLENLQDSLRQMLTWFISPKSIGLAQDGEHAVHMVANHLAEGFTVLDNGLHQERSTEIEIAPLDESLYHGNDELYLAPVIELAEWARAEISEHVSDFMLHGSLATLDYSRGWSDFDTFVIVTREAALNGRALIELRTGLLDAYSYLTTVDPLQHHGFLVCTEIDLNRYQDHIMPLVVLQKAKSYFGAKKHYLNPIQDIAQERKNLASRASFFRNAAEQGVMKHHAHEGTYLQGHYRNAENGLFQLKYLLGTGAIAPCYYAGVIGEPAYKSDAIKHVRPLLSEPAKTFLDSTTSVREQWPKREQFPYAGNRIPNWIREFVEPDYIVNLANLLSELEQLAGDST